MRMMRTRMMVMMRRRMRMMMIMMRMMRMMMRMMRMMMIMMMMRRRMMMMRMMMMRMMRMMRMMMKMMMMMVMMMIRMMMLMMMMMRMMRMRMMMMIQFLYKFISVLCIVSHASRKPTPSSDWSDPVRSDPLPPPKPVDVDEFWRLDGRAVEGLPCCLAFVCVEVITTHGFREFHYPNMVDFSIN